MRGSDERSGALFSYVDVEARVPAGHPLRRIRELVNGALTRLDGKFAALYSADGRPSVPPERLIRASLLQLFYSIRSERQLMERLDFDLLFRWFVGLGIDDAVWDHSVFSKNRDRLLTTETAQDFLAALLADPKVKRLLSHEHFSVDGTLLKAWASMKSFRPKDGGGQPPEDGRNGERDFRGEKRSNETHESTTDPEARLYRKGNGQESKLCYMGHALMENRNGLAIGGVVTQATGTAEREAALELIDRHRSGQRRITLGGDKGFDVADFIGELRARNVTPHIAIDGHVRVSGAPRKTAVDKRITRHPGYAVSQVIRKRIEEIFGWSKSIGGLAQVKLRGLVKVNAAFTFGLAAYNLVRLPKLLPSTG
ncbi:MAG TPA: IS5 family transposase [Methyloceanibacter sp.]|nr:IS5 family transposase [Methyloceanibacter sp.]